MNSLADQLKSTLVIDPQEDCSCDVEFYESMRSLMIYLDRGEVKENRSVSSLALPMSSEPITDEQFISCFMHALQYARPTSKVDCCNVILTPYELDVDTKQIINECFDDIYFLPDPEHLGVYTWNVSKFGMFIIPESILKLV